MSIRKINRYKSIIFDLDGTLLDTLVDIQSACNLALKDMGINKEYNYEECKTFIGNGALIFAQRATKDLAFTKEEFDKYYDIYLKYYESEQGKNTYPYDGIIELLNYLKANNINAFVVTNKPNNLAYKIIDKTIGVNLFKEICGKKEGYAPKPDPTLINEIVDKYNLNKDEILYVGDSSVDLLTAKNANIDSLIVTYGYGDYSLSFINDATYVVKKASEIVDIISK